MADNRKLTAGLLKMPEAQRQDLARMGEEYKRFQEADYLRKMGEQGMGLAKSVARGVPQMATGLVDLAAMPFEAAGVLQPGQAVGSTKWLESKGYLPEQQEGFLNQTAELLSGGFDPSDLVTKGAPLLMGIGKTVWHGSPHTFDKFDLSKIGTGEGAQAYGHGLYLADAKQTAEEYRRNLMGGNDMASQIAATHLNMYKTPEKAAEALQASLSPNLTSEAKQVTQNAIDMLNRGEANTGFLYKVDLPDEQIAKMLDWDKPFSEQPESVRNVLNDLASSIAKQSNEQRMLLNQQNPERLTHPVISKLAQKESFAEDVAGNKLHEYLARELGGSEKVSEYLRQQGIPGIQYLDQGSRGAGEGTRNYVVFSDEIPQILERNNIPVNK